MMEKKEVINILNNMDNLQWRNKGQDSWYEFDDATITGIIRYLYSGLELRVKPKPKKVPLSDHQMLDLVGTTIYSPGNSAGIVNDFNKHRIESSTYVGIGSDSDGYASHLFLTASHLMDFKNSDGEYLCNWEEVVD